MVNPPLGRQHETGCRCLVWAGLHIGTTGFAHQPVSRADGNSSARPQLSTHSFTHAIQRLGGRKPESTAFWPHPSLAILPHGCARVTFVPTLPNQPSSGRINPDNCRKISCFDLDPAHRKSGNLVNKTNAKAADHSIYGTGCGIERTRFPHSRQPADAIITQILELRSSQTR